MPDELITETVAKTYEPLYGVFGAWAVSLFILIIVSVALVFFIVKIVNAHRADRDDWFNELRDDREKYNEEQVKREERQTQVIDNNTEALGKVETALIIFNSKNA